MKSIIETIKPCPFCGAKANTNVRILAAQQSSVKFSINCPKCRIELEETSSCYGFGDVLANMDAVITKWNGRVADDEKRDSAES